jgi:hypothetical protein
MRIVMTANLRAPRRGIARFGRLAGLALLLAGCRRDPARAVLGEWRSDAGRMMFYPDGEVVMEQRGFVVADSDSAATTPTVTTSVARYEFVKKPRRLRIRALAADPADYTVAASRDSLVLCSSGPGAHCFRMARIPVRER